VDPNTPDTNATTIESEYSSIISQHISYFNELPDAGKKGSWKEPFIFGVLNTLVT